MTTCHHPDFDGWLDLCRDRDHDGLYFLGPRQSRITFYTQQVRGLHLVHALAATGRLKAGERIAVIGAGAGGVTAAMAFALAGAEVTLYDPADGILQLQSASTRLLHPHIYEWPALGSLDDQAGLPILDWMADAGGKVVNRLTTEFNAARAYFGARLLFQKSHTLEGVAPAGTDWRLTFKGDDDPKRVSKVVLAIGFGQEAAFPGAETLGYWKSGAIDAGAKEASAGARYFVSGRGDGGLTDLMALMVDQFQHVEFARQVLARFTDDALTRAAEAAFEGKALDDDLEPDFERHILPALKEADVLTWLRERLRTDRYLTFNSAGTLFAHGRAARLNQILAFAVLEAAKLSTNPVARTSGMVCEIAAGADARSVTFKGGAPGPVAAHRVVCRHGPGTDALYAVAKTAYEAHLNRVTATLACKPELGAPLVLHPETYGFFETRRLEQLVSGPQAIELQSAAARRAAAIRLGEDAASHRLSEQGGATLAAIAERCERGDDREIHITAPPSRVPHAADLIRLARASGGRITLTAGAAVHTAWAGLSPSIPVRPPPGTQYRPIATGDADVGASIDACLLRLLHAGLTKAIKEKKAALIGPICTEIADGVEQTWTEWRGALEADAGLRARFLRWLYSVDPEGRMPWTGDHAVMPDLIAALVLVLATHLGEPLKPAMLDRGNLELGGGGSALGSGCRTLGDEPLSQRTDPEDWGVEAIILSGVNEVDMIDPNDRLTGDAGAGGLRAARRVRPAMILNGKPWNRHLKAGLSEWLEAVRAEFKDLKARQDKALEETEA